MDIKNETRLLIETLEAYGNRLYLNAAMNILINGLAAYIILKFSTKAMGWYKYYILATIFSAFVMDFHSCFVYGFYIILPTSISCPTGLVKRLGWFWGSHFNFTLIHINIGFCGMSIFYSFVYQYTTLTRSPEIFQRPKTIFFMFISMILVPLPSTILYVINVDYEAGKTWAFQNVPHLAPIYVSWSCNMSLMNSLLYVYLIVAMSQILLLYILAIIFTFKIRRKLAESRNLMSTNTINARKQYLFALIVQAAVPAIFIVFPICFLMITVVFGMSNVKDAQWVFQFFGLHSCGNSIAVMFIIKPYRQALIQYVQKFFGIFCKCSKVKPTTNSVIISITNHH